MPTSDLQDRTRTGLPSPGNPIQPELVYKATFIESPNILVSVFRQLRELMREPKITVPQKYYRGEATLPLTDAPPWYLDIPNVIKTAFEKPRPPAIPLTSKPIDVPDLWQDYRQEPASWVNSILVHVLGIAALNWLK